MRLNLLTIYFWGFWVNPKRKYTSSAVYALVFGLLSSASSCTSQKVVTSTNIRAINVPAKLLEVDNLGRIYVVDNRNDLINYRPDMTEQYRYANRRSGHISSIDLTNPLKVVVYYDDFNQVKILDNTLSIISELNLNDFYADISACSSSNDGNLWIYDPINFKLKKVNDEGTTLIESSNTNDFGLQSAYITRIIERNNLVVLFDVNQGFFIFDNLGQFVFRYQSLSVTYWNFEGGFIHSYNPNEPDIVTKLDINSLDIQQLKIPYTATENLKTLDVNPLKVILKSNKFYLMYADGIDVLKRAE